MNLNLYIIKCLFFYKGISNDFKIQLLIEVKALILPYADNQMGIPVQRKVADNQLSYRNTQRRLKTTYCTSAGTFFDFLRGVYQVRCAGNAKESVSFLLNSLASSQLGTKSGIAGTYCGPVS